jgi:hypothetical protein
MKKTLFTGLMLIAGVVWFVGQHGAARAGDGSLALKVSYRAVDLSHLAPELVIPAALPAGLVDPILLEAWIRLYNHSEPFVLWDGTIINGRALAENLRDRAIPLVWDIQGMCRNASCSRQFCMGEMCTYDDGQPGVDPIFFFPGHGTQMTSLVATLAHESFHRMQPFGPVHDTRFEEFWACKLSAAFDPASGFTFEGYDPLVAGYLTLWIRDNNVPNYFALPDYPPSIAAEIARSAAP